MIFKRVNGESIYRPNFRGTIFKSSPRQHTHSLTRSPTFSHACLHTHAHSKSNQLDVGGSEINRRKFTNAHTIARPSRQWDRRRGFHANGDLCVGLCGRTCRTCIVTRCIMFTCFAVARPPTRDTAVAIVTA